MTRPHIGDQKSENAELAQPQILILHSYLLSSETGGAR